MASPSTVPERGRGPRGQRDVPAFGTPGIAAHGAPPTFKNPPPRAIWPLLLMGAFIAISAGMGIPVIQRFLLHPPAEKVQIPLLRCGGQRETSEEVALGAFVAMVCGAVSVLNLESGSEANIETASDAMWWAFVTITTVGYGDCYPVTLGGRLVAAVLMVVGVGLFGTFTAYVASFFIGDQEDEDAILREIRCLREEVGELRRTMAARDTVPPLEKEPQ